MHPIRSIRSLFSYATLVVKNFQMLGFMLLSAIEKNTKAVEENTQFLKAQYWAVVEQSRRQTAIPTPAPKEIQ